MDKNFAEKTIASNQKLYNLIAGQFSETRKFNWLDFEEFLNYIKENDQVLDVGCGNGRFFELLAKKNIHYQGLDFSERLIEIARQKYPGQKFQVDSILNLPYADQTFDVVVCAATLHHIPSKDFRLKAMQEMSRILKPDGYLLMLNWNLWQYAWWKLHFKIVIKKIFCDLPIDFRDILKPWRNSQGEIVGKRYIHGFGFLELKKLGQACNLKSLEQFFNIKGKKTHWLKGYNLVSIFQKNHLK